MVMESQLEEARKTNEMLSEELDDKVKQIKQHAKEGNPLLEKQRIEHVSPTFCHL